MSTEYTKTTWQTGDIITADKMNNIENGIKGIEGDITTLSGMGSEIDELGEELTDIKDGLGDISSLETEDKSSLVNAINEIFEGGGSGGSDVQIYASGEDLIINSVFVDGNEVSY